KSAARVKIVPAEGKGGHSGGGTVRAAHTRAEREPVCAVETGDPLRGDLADRTEWPADIHIGTVAGKGLRVYRDPVDPARATQSGPGGAVPAGHRTRDNGTGA